MNLKVEFIMALNSKTMYNTVLTLFIQAFTGKGLFWPSLVTALTMKQG